MAELRRAPGLRERAPGIWELVVEAGRDPVTGKRRRVSKSFHGTLREAKKARAELLTEVTQGRHLGTTATVDQLYAEWIKELERKGRAPNTIRNYAKTYRVNIRPGFGSMAVKKVTTKMLTDLYGAHQERGLSPASVRHIHATMSSMMTQACRWGWRDTNPAQWAEPPPLRSAAPQVPTPAEIDRLISAARQSKRPEYAGLIFIAATTGMRRGELCALRFGDVDWDRELILVARSIIDLSRQPLREGPTKNRRLRRVALDQMTLEVLAARQAALADRAQQLGTVLDGNAFVFSDEPDGSEPWRPMMVTRYFGRLASRLELGHLSFHSLRRFLDTYGPDLGFAPVQVAMRAGHDPSVAARFYTGSVADADRRLAGAIAELISSPATIKE